MVGWEREGTNCAFFVHEFSVDEDFSAWITFPTHATTGESSFIPSVYSFASFLPFLTLKIGWQRRGEAGGCSEDPRGGQGARCGPMPRKQGKGIWGTGPWRAHPPVPPAAMGSSSSPCFGFVFLGFGGFFVGFFFALSSSVGQIPSAEERRRDNQLPRPKLAKTAGLLVCSETRETAPGHPKPPPGAETFPDDAPKSPSLGVTSQTCLCPWPARKETLKTVLHQRPTGPRDGLERPISEVFRPRDVVWVRGTTQHTASAPTRLSRATQPGFRPARRHPLWLKG